MADFCSTCDEALDTGSDYDLPALAAEHLKEPGDVYSFPPCEGCMVCAIGIDEAGNLIEWHAGEEEPVPLGSVPEFLYEDAPPPDVLGDAKFAMINAVVEAYERGEVPTVLVSQNAQTGEQVVRLLESQSASVSIDEGIATLKDALGQLERTREAQRRTQAAFSVWVRSPGTGPWKAVAAGAGLGIAGAIEIAEGHRAEGRQAEVRVRAEIEELPF